MLVNLEKINFWFEKRTYGLIKHRWWFILLYIVVLALCIYGTTLVNIDVSNENSFLKNDPINKLTDEFEEIFGNDQYVGILVENENLFSHETLSLIREFHNHLKDSVLFVERVSSLNDIEYSVGTEEGIFIGQVVPDTIPTDALALNEIKRKVFAKENFRKRLVSNDGKQTWVTIKFAPFPEEWKGVWEDYPQLLAGESVEKIVTLDKYKSLHPRAVGMPVINYQKREFFAKETGKIMGFAFLIATIILIIALRSLWGVLIPLITAISAMMIMQGVVGFTGVEVDNKVLSFPFLIGFAVSIAYSIHIFSFFKRHFLRYGNRKEAIVYAIGEMGWAVLFTALTTMTALMSAIFIPVKTVRFLGLSTAGIVAAAYLVVMILTPTLLSFGKNRKPHPRYAENKYSKFEHSLVKLGEWILNNPVKIIVPYLLCTLILLYGATKVKVDTDPRKALGDKVAYVRNLFEVASTELGTLYSYDVMIELPEPGMAKEPTVLHNLEMLSHTALQSPLTKRTSSILDVIKDMNQVLHGDDKSYYKIPQDKSLIAQLLLLYENAGGTEAEYWVDYEYRYLRLSVHLFDMKINELMSAFDEVVETANQLFPDAKVSVVGTIPQFIKMINYITKGQIVSFGIALIVIAMLMMFVFGNVRTGLIALIPNITPVLVIGGIMGFLDIPLDSSTVIIMPMILGLAVDDTIHFINHSKLEFIRTGNYRKSILRSMSSVGVALIFTTLVLSGNFLTYMISEVRFYFFLGILAVSGMLSALVADFFVTPLLFKRFKIFGEELVTVNKE